jgi:hypothetical protein
VNSSLLACDAVPLHHWYPAFRRIVVFFILNGGSYSADNPSSHTRKLDNLKCSDDQIVKMWAGHDNRPQPGFGCNTLRKEFAWTIWTEKDGNIMMNLSSRLINILGLLKCVEFLDSHRNYQLLIKMGVASWKWRVGWLVASFVSYTIGCR